MVKNVEDSKSVIKRDTKGIKNPFKLNFQRQKMGCLSFTKQTWNVITIDQTQKNRIFVMHMKKQQKILKISKREIRLL